MRTFPDKNIVRRDKYERAPAREEGDKTVKNMQLREMLRTICLIRAEKHCLPNMCRFMNGTCITSLVVKRFLRSPRRAISCAVRQQIKRPFYRNFSADKYPVCYYLTYEVISSDYVRACVYVLRERHSPLVSYCESPFHIPYQICTGDISVSGRFGARARISRAWRRHENVEVQLCRAVQLQRATILLRPVKIASG